MPAVKQSFATANVQVKNGHVHDVTSSTLPSSSSSSSSSSAHLDIIDIRRQKTNLNLKQEIIKHLNPAQGSPSLPTLLLYDEKGLQLFEQITYLDEYYLTNYEIELLSKHATEMASLILAGAMVVELGSGNLRKISLLLDAFERLEKPIDYYALDLSEEELRRTLLQVPRYTHVRCHGLFGTYDDGKDWLRRITSDEADDRSICIIHLGSSIGNFGRDEAAAFLQGFAQVLRPSDSILIGVDSCCDPEKVYRAYNDSKGITHSFIINGLLHANVIFARDVFDPRDWKVVGEFVYDEDGGRHQAFLSPNTDVVVDVLGTTIKQAERIKIEQSLKYSQVGVETLWRKTGLRETHRWRRGQDYGLYLLRRIELPFSSLLSEYGSVLPTLKDWSAVWQAWNLVTRSMLPRDELGEKPIPLRNACIFYLGHIPTFLDIQLDRVTQQQQQQLPGVKSSSYYQRIFERGIDPDVDNPVRCHDHSEIPDEWPPVEEILAYQDRVRARLEKLYLDAGMGDKEYHSLMENKQKQNLPRNVARAVWVAFEHELMHLETLLYMMLQSDRTLPPPHVPAPDFAALAAAARTVRVPDNAWIHVPAQTFILGMDDPENGTDPDVHFGWDNEKPARSHDVLAFEAKARPITNEEYADFLFSTNNDHLPASWSRLAPDSTMTNGSSTSHGHSPVSNGADNSDLHNPMQSYLRDKAVRTVYGPVPLQFALDWPVTASYDELAGCAAWMGGRIPTMEEARSIYTFAEKQKKASMHSKLANRVPAVNAHLVNDGVEETPPLQHSSASSSSTSASLFVDLQDANVGFKNWHPLPVTAHGDTLAGQADMGGVWEWTSSLLARHPGFEPMALYPAYTADFFDGKHNVVLGGSWATHPRIAGRRSFVNWYQRNYPYAWAGARLVRDV